MHRITLIPGDGIGPEVTRAARDIVLAFLAASAAAHRELATAFLENLKSLAAEGPDRCYDFISRGETSPSILALMQDSTKSGRIEAQVVAIVAAISEGRRSPTTHSGPGKPDYDVLATELGRLGWTQADMQLFADSKALAKASGIFRPGRPRSTGPAVRRVLWFRGSPG